MAVANCEPQSIGILEKRDHQSRLSNIVGMNVAQLSIVCVCPLSMHTTVVNVKTFIALQQMQSVEVLS